MSDIKIRNAETNDFDHIFRIWLENQLLSTGKSSESKIGEDYKNELFQSFSLSNAHYYVAVSHSNEVIGWQSLTPLFNNPALSPFIAQSSTYVDRNFFRTNVAQTLFEFAYADAKKNGIDQIYGWVKPENKAIQRIAENFKHFKTLIPGSGQGNVPEFNMFVLEVE